MATCSTEISWCSPTKLPAGRLRRDVRTGYGRPERCEAGLSAYQHPERNEKISRFDESVDDFSALVILLTLACVDADLWERYHEEGRLLLSEEDIAKPGESALLIELAGRKGKVGTLAKLVRTAAEQDIDQVPSFGSVVRELGMEWRAGPEEEAGAG